MNVMNERLLEWFREHPNEYISGESLSRELNVSRTAVWKHIRELKSQGYVFDAVPRLGYKLMSAPSVLDIGELQASLRSSVLGKHIHYFDTVDSTQNVARQLLEQGVPEGTLVIAEQQTAGRGRFRRAWLSPKGKGIWMTLVLKPSLPLQFIPQLTLLAAVALCRAVRKVVPEVNPGIKWPNDLLVNGKKISGILLESSAENECLQYVAAGIGISVNLEQSDIPEELRTKITSLKLEAGREIDRIALVAECLEQLEELYKLYTESGFAPIRTLWEASSVTLGRKIRLQTPKGWIEGYAESLDEAGALTLTGEDGGTFQVYTGDLEW